MRQKFGAYSFVHVQKDMPDYMKHFPSDFDAIVGGTYSQLYGGTDIKSYSLYVIGDNGCVINSVSWYFEDQLTAIIGRTKEEAEDMVEDYRFRGRPE